MRDIKFRVWDNDADYMGYLYPDMTYMEGTGKWLIDDLGETLNMDDKTIELYTGIKDINGVEIYEGDIIKFHVVILSPDDKVGYVTYYPEYGYSIILSSGSLLRQEYWASGDKHTIEVIGNIHEDEELLQ